MSDVMFESEPTEVMFYGRDDSSRFFDGPRLICKVSVVRCTATQLIVSVPAANKQTKELRFRRDDGGLVGGTYGSEKVKPISHDTALEASESDVRRRVHAAVQIIGDAERQLGRLRVSSLPMAKLHEIEADLSLVRHHLRKILALTKSETT
jgi:hypothetical protein